MKRVVLGCSLGWVLALAGCQAEADPPAAEPQAAPTDQAIDPALVRELLGEAIQVEGEQLRVDGLLVRLAFEPLIRQTGPVTLQLAQGQGYRLTGVGDGSPLWLLGLRDGDVLTHVDGKAILGREHELRSVFEARPAKIEITTTRGAETKTLRLYIAASPTWRSPESPLDRPDRPERTIGPRLPVPDATTRSATASEFAEHLRCVDGGSEAKIGRCEIERAAFDSLLTDPTGFVTHARVVPATRDGKVIGIKVYGIRRDSIPSRLGIKNGDLILTVDGRPVGELEAALEAWAALPSQAEFTLTIERRARVTTLEIAIVDALSGPPASFSSVGSAPEISPDLKDPFAD